MTTTELLQELKRHPFLAGVSDHTFSQLEPLTQLVGLMPGQYLGHQGEDARAFYLITSGHVQLELLRKDRPVTRVCMIGPGEVVGWSWLLPPHRWQFAARALDPVRALELDAVELRRLCESDAEIGFELAKRLMAVICNRLAATRHGWLQADDHT